MANDLWTGARLGTNDDAPLGGSYLAEIVTELAAEVCPSFANAAARDTALTNWVAAGNTATTGMRAYTANDKRYWRLDALPSTWAYAGGAPPPITAVTVASGYVAGSNFAPGCYKDASGLVSVVGGVVNGGSYTPSGNNMMTLPVGFWPQRDIAVPVMLAAGWAIGGVYASDGSVRINVGPSIGSSTLHTVNFSFHPGFVGGGLS